MPGLVDTMENRQQKPDKPNDPSTRSNFDKGSLRRMYRQPFERAIASKSAASDPGHSVLRYGTGDATTVQVYARKRPLFPAEAQADFDVINVDDSEPLSPSPHSPPLSVPSLSTLGVPDLTATTTASPSMCCVAEGAPTIFDARLQADMQRAYLDCHRFPIPCLAESATNAEVCDQIQLPGLLEMARSGGHATCLMFGQTGSGKTHSMSAIMETSAHMLFNRALPPPGGDRPQINTHAHSVLF